MSKICAFEQSIRVVLYIIATDLYYSVAFFQFFDIIIFCRFYH